VNIIFAHNSHNRPKTLINTINEEKKYFPNSIFYLSVTKNGTINEEIINDTKNLIVIPTDGNSWQLGCINCFYSSISKICEDYDDGIIIFSHDDVYLTNIDVVKDNIQLMINENIPFIVRRPDILNFGENYYMMEVVFLNLKHIKKIFTPYDTFFIKEESLIPRDKNNYSSAEVWLYEKLNSLKNGLIINYPHCFLTIEEINNNLTKNLGYKHINLGQNGWNE
jgi:hypothetical protein